MGGEDKGLIELDGRPLVTHVLAAIAPQVDAILINANRNDTAYRALGHPVIADDLDGFQGPLAGFAAAMATVSTRYLVTLPCDAPRLPTDYVERMASALSGAAARIAVAHDGDRLQPVHALLDTGLRDDLLGYLAGGDRKIDLWYARHPWVQVDFSDAAGLFHNINTPDERDRLQQEGATA